MCLLCDPPPPAWAELVVWANAARGERAMTAPRLIAANVLTIELLPNLSMDAFRTEGVQNARFRNGLSMGDFAHCLGLSAHVHRPVYAEFLPGDEPAQVGGHAVVSGVLVFERGRNSVGPDIVWTPARASDRVRPRRVPSRFLGLASQANALITLIMPPAPWRFIVGASACQRRGR